MKFTHSLGLLFLMGLTPAHAQFRNLWVIGADNDGTAEFPQESNSSNLAPGNANGTDDDFYIAGEFPDPIGVLAEAEGFQFFERAVTNGDPNSRIHFDLSPSEADAAAVFQLDFQLIAGGFAGDGFGVHDVEVTFNGNTVTTQVDITGDTILSASFDGADVSAVSGENIIEITRTGGDSAGDGSDLGWIQFDILTLQIDESAIDCLDAICGFTTSLPSIPIGGSATLAWRTNPGASVSIDQGIGVVSPGTNSVEVTPTADTTYTITSVLNGETSTETVLVRVGLLNLFDTDLAETSPSLDTVILSWEVDPADGVTVSIAPDIGDVTAITNFGFGSMPIQVLQDTTYTITVTRPNAPNDDVSTSEVSIDFEFDDFTQLWQLGVEDGNQNEFNQELFGTFDAPGSPTARDDDYYFAGNYETVGIVAVDEVVTDPVDQTNASANPLGMERSVTNGAPNTRIHFILTADQAASDQLYRFSTTLLNGGWFNADTGGNGGFGIHDIDISFNNEIIFTTQGLMANTDVSESFAASSVNAVAGENVVEIMRTGGASNPADPAGNLGWIQFDQFRLETRTSADLQEADFEVTDFVYSSSDEEATVTFPSRSGQTFLIETSQDLEIWEILDPAVLANPTETSTTFSYDAPDPKAFIRVTRN